MSLDTSSEPVRRARRSSLVTCLLTGTAVAALTTTAMSAPADATTSTTSTARLTDPVGDVWAIGEGEDEEWALAGDMPTADVVGAVVRHRARRVVVRMDFANLRRVDPASYTALITTPEKIRGVFVIAGPGGWAGDRHLVNGNFGNVRCRGFQHSIDYATDTVIMSVPRTCLGRPRWVRVEMANYTFRGDSEEDFQEITDNPHSSDPDGRSTGRLHRAR